MRWNSKLCLVVFCGALWGCTPEAEKAPDPEVPSAGEAIEPAETELGNPSPAPEGQTEDPEIFSSTNPIPLEIKDWEEIQAFIGEQKGKVVVVDLWSTYCPPCLKEFPNLVQLHKTHPAEVQCISVSLDYAGFEDEPIESYTEKVRQVLQKMGATFPNFLCSVPSEIVFNEKIPQGSIPVVFVYNRDGKLAGQFPDPENPSEFTYQENVLPLVQNLLSEE